MRATALSLVLALALGGPAVVAAEPAGAQPASVSPRAQPKPAARPSPKHNPKAPSRGRSSPLPQPFPSGPESRSREAAA